LGKLTWILIAIAIAWAGLIFYLLTANDPLGYGYRVFGFPDRVMSAGGHLGLFAVLAAVLAIHNLTRGSSKHSVAKSLGVAILLSAAYGGLLELYQNTLPLRDASLVDSFINTAGAMVGAISGELLVRVLDPRRYA